MLWKSSSRNFATVILFILIFFFSLQFTSASEGLFLGGYNPTTGAYTSAFAPTGANPAGGDVTADSIDCLPDATPKGCPPCAKAKLVKGKCVPDPTKWGCTCKSHVAPVVGKCIATNVCLGQSFSNQSGQSQGMGDMKGFMDAMKGVMDKLMQKKEGGGEGQQQGQQTGQQGCTSYTQVSDQALVNNTGPNCTYYVAPTSDSLLGGGTGSNNAFNSLWESLTGGGGSGFGEVPGLGGEGEEFEGEGGELPGDLSEKILGGLAGEEEVGTTGGGEEASSTTSGSTSTLSKGAVKLGGGTEGNIEITEGGVTVTAKSQDPESNTGVAGFYGSNTFDGQPEGTVARLCRTRPWANSLVSYVIPPAFFDGLCKLRGYQVGMPTPSPSPTTPSAPKKQPTAATTTKQKPVSSTKPEADIWAVPARVPLGGRTSVFWNSKGVESCIVESADGNFHETSLSGGAATVPLSGATEFTITCLAPDGTSVEASVTVGLTI